MRDEFGTGTGLNAERGTACCRLAAVGFDLAAVGVELEEAGQPPEDAGGRGIHDGALGGWVNAAGTAPGARAKVAISDR